ncbi:hypothetical protein GCM10007890_44270 [Methylobacterium tardum]|jgi:hypothetical protein|uniref:Uncharacterized protein n=1 Tax=Methylobacterium tardum TaxID=374432 RepID=A0AA37THW1_9HYPH|nr:hypothetical protein GCM10007890_44270 [Methylobacterium tardum]
MQYRLRIARSRAHGSVDIASETIEACGVSEAIEAASRAMGLFLADLPGVGILTDAVEDGLVWSSRWNMPPPPESDFIRF